MRSEFAMILGVWSLKITNILNAKITFYLWFQLLYKLRNPVTLYLNSSKQCEDELKALRQYSRVFSDFLYLGEVVVVAQAEL